MALTTLVILLPLLLLSPGKAGACSLGYWGESCSLSCPSHCLINSCDETDGTCTYGCESGYSGKHCCIPGRFGLDCSGTCSQNCLTCSSATSCTECNLSYYGELCINRCPTGCASDLCITKDGECYSCTLGFYGKFCTEKCPMNCLLRICDGTTGKCRLCASGYYGDKCCSDNSSVIVCPTICPTQCQICTDDNSCLKCNPGYYGDTCSRTCSPTCLNGTCHTNTGVCSLGCQSGFYGDQCLSICSLRCKNGNCYQYTGVCVDGCINGYELSGTNCERVIGNDPIDETSTSDRSSNIPSTTTVQSETSKASSTIAIAVGVSLGVVLLITFLIIGVCYFQYLRRRKAAEATNPCDTNVHPRAQKVHTRDTNIHPRYTNTIPAREDLRTESVYDEIQDNGIDTYLTPNTSEAFERNTNPASLEGYLTPRQIEHESTLPQRHQVAVIENSDTCSSGYLNLDGNGATPQAHGSSPSSNPGQEEPVIPSGYISARIPETLDLSPRSHEISVPSGNSDTGSVGYVYLDGQQS